MTPRRTALSAGPEHAGDRSPESGAAPARRTLARIAAGAAGWCLAAMLACPGCSPARRTAVADTDPAGWSSPAELTLRSGDTAACFDLGLFLRTGNGPASDSLLLRTVFLSPDSLRCERTLRLAMPRREGPASLAREFRIPLLRSVRLRSEGTYRILLVPLAPIRGVEAAGIDLEPKQ